MQNLYFSFPRAILRVSQKLYSGSLRVHESHCFVDSWIQGSKIIKSSLLGLVLSTSGAMAGKSSNRASWDWFCRLLEPWPESHQIEPLGIGFVDFLSQCWKVIKSSLLGFVLSHRFTIPAQYYIRRTFDYRIIVHWVTCSWVPCLLTEPLGDPQKICVYAKIFPLYFVRRRCHIPHFIVPCKVGTPRSVMS